MRNVTLVVAVIIVYAFAKDAMAAYAPINLGQIQQQAEQIRLDQERRREIELENAQRQDELQRRREAESNQKQANIAGASSNQASLDPISKKFDEAIKYRRYRFADFDQVVLNPALRITAEMLALMAESPLAADIAYYLGKHPTEAAAIGAMQLSDAGKAIRELEDRISKTMTSAPPNGTSAQ